MRKKKEKHAVQLENEKHENALDFRINYNKIKQTFIDYQVDPPEGDDGKDESSETSSITTEYSGSMDSEY